MGRRPNAQRLQIYNVMPIRTDARGPVQAEMFIARFYNKRWPGAWAEIQIGTGVLLVDLQQLRAAIDQLCKHWPPVE